MSRAIATIPSPANGAVIGINDRLAIIIWVNSDGLNGHLASTAPTMSSRGTRRRGILYATPDVALAVAQKERLLIQSTPGHPAEFRIPTAHPYNQYRTPALLDLGDGQNLEVHYLQAGHNFIVHLAIA